jgi:hypothetical protein
MEDSGAVPSVPSPLALREVFDIRDDAGWRPEVQSNLFARSRWDVAGRGSFILDRFADLASCAFLRIAPTATGIVRFALDGAYGMESCPCGGWLLIPRDADLATYWIPRSPALRSRDSHERILSEAPASLVAFAPNSGETTIDVATRSGLDLECVVWRLPPEASELVENLASASVLERQPVFMLSSHTSFRDPSDLYVYLIHGQVYEDRFDALRKRKICSELEAYSAYVALHGLEAATGKALYRLLKRQLVLSVIARQSPEGGWRHGEWTDDMESHFRLHNAAMLLLEAALEETPEETIRSALDRAASVLSRNTDKTDLGVWFFHDSLEQSVEMTEKSGIRWVSSRELGKSPATKMILNSHLDAIVTLDRFREVTGDDRYRGQVESALDATRKLLALRPAEWLYRVLYRAVGLTLLPESEARRLPLALRAVKRLTRDHLLPRLHNVKRRFPRMVMPGGLIERHLSRLHFGVNYHSVNVADLARLWRRFPREDFQEVIAAAVRAVTDTTLLSYWIEANQRQALGYWVEALYQLCTLAPDRSYRRFLADAVLAALDAGLGLPPSLLGAHPEVVKPADRFPCPSPSDARLRIANLSCDGRREILVVNPTRAEIALTWERKPADGLVWSSSDEVPMPAGARLSVPARGWIAGKA